MNILFLSLFPIEANKGGVQRVTETLAFSFQELGHLVFYLSATKNAPKSVSGIRQYSFQVPLTKVRENTLYTESLLHELKIDVMINQASISKELITVLSGIRKEHLRIYTVHHNCIACYLDNYRNIVLDNMHASSTLRKVDYPIIWSILKMYNRVKYGRQFERVLDVSDKMILLSERFIPELRLYNVHKNLHKVIAIPNPAPFKVQKGVEKFKENRLLFVGRLDFHQKRVDILVELWHRLFTLFPTWSLDVLGDGPMREFIENKIKELNLERITVHGYTDPRPFLQRAKLFCMTSAFEGYGMVLVEAQAYGVVPLAFNCYSGLQDIITHGESGMIYKKFDIDSYVEGLTSLMSNDGVRAEMAVKAQKDVLKYDARQVADTWLKIM